MHELNEKLVKLGLSGILAMLTSFYSPVMNLMVAVLWLVAFDVLTGAYVAKVINREALTSRKFFRKMPQLLMFLVALTASIHADPFFVQFGLEEYKAAKFVVSFYGIYELLSILENLGKSGLPVAKQIAAMLKAKLPEEVKNNLEGPK